MFLSVLSVAVMTIMFLYMMRKARFGRTRRLALIPLGCVVVELFAAGLLSPALFPVLTAALVLLKAVILLCCVCAMRQDAGAALRRARRSAALSESSSGGVSFQTSAVMSRCA